LAEVFFEDAAVKFFHNAVQIFDLHPQKGGADEVPDRALDGAQRVPGDNGGGRRLAVPRLAGVGDHPDHHVLHGVYRAQSGLEGVAEGKGDAACLNILNDHENAP